MSKKLAGKCDAFCQLGGQCSRRAVFADSDSEVKKYYCGLGKKDCIIVYLAKKVDSCYDLADRTGEVL